ncbi:MAG: STAS domain-containing protein [bacterium]
MPKFEIQHEVKTKYLVIRLSGRIAGEASIDLYRQIKNLLEQYDKLNLILDFKGLEFIDSSGLGFLVAVNSTLLKQGRNLTLAAVPENLMGLLKITNLDRVLKIVATIEKAV